MHRPHFHSHSKLEKDDVGSLIMCHRFGKILQVAFQPPGGDLYYPVDDDKLSALGEAQTMEQAMAVIRR